MRKKCSTKVENNRRLYRREGMKLFKYIPHKCWYKVTGNNGLTHTPCEKTCILCGESIHLPWDGFLKDTAKWLDGKFPWRT